MTQIFTIGHSTHELAEFLQLLRAHQVGQVADVRTHPGSRRMPWFNRASLARELPAHGLPLHGWAVMHIGPDGRATAHELTPFAVADAERLTYPPIQPSLGAG